ncbi:hypothetical protein [Alteromonas confluentis]|uniref:Cohesin domain-containing protein n=1 Tax=Alteromonas confluentis TaxID=1656094 RepID=A0A1E7Z6A5_9ALTE|nr:hypothetical protein [Alteromonas confluentis]OFC69089.1 hypothetical protein BFC18_20360 [Alteromonas confluentis]
MKHLCILSSVMLMLGSATASAAPVLSFGELEQDYLYSAYEGDSLEIPVWISGLDPENVGGFDVTFTFDEPVTDLVSVDFSLDSVGTFIYDSVDSYGEVTLSAVSLDWDLSGQPSAFQIASLTFSAVSAGLGQMMFTDVLLSDDFGSPLSLADSFIADINVMSVQVPPTPVPAPPAAGLMLFSLLLLPLRKRLFKS